MVSITRLTFLVHPYCYAASLGVPASMDRGRWQAYHDHEVRVAEGWQRLLADAPGDEAVVFHPCFDSAEVRELIDAGRRHLADRFLELPGRAELYSAETLAALAPEIDAAFRVRGKYEWSIHDLRIAAFSWHYARDLTAGFAERGMTWDAATLRLRAVGESFEGCATTWSTMLPAYLDCPARVEIDYRDTVPDTAFLLDCRYDGRLAREPDTALHLFTDDDGRQLVHWKRERVTLDAPSLTARLPIDPDRVEVLTGSGQVLLGAGVELPDAVPADLARRVDDGLEVLVTTGRGRGAGGPGFYPREAPLFVRAAADAGLHDAARAAIIEPAR